MKKRTLALFTAACLALPVAFSFSSCAQINEKKWVEELNQPNFSYSNRVTGEHFAITNHTIELDGTFYYTEDQGGNTLYFCGARMGSSDNMFYETTEITKEAYEEATAGCNRESCAVFLDYVRDNFKAFTKVESYHYYLEGDKVPAEIDAWLDSALGQDNDFYSIDIDGWEGNVNLRVYLNEAAGRYGDDYDLRNQLINEQVIVFNGFGDLYSWYHRDMAVENAKKDGMKVVGGKDADYMEMYFKDGMMRYYTPNQPLEDGNVDCVFTSDEGVYKFYLKKKNAAWTVQTLEKEVWEQRVNQIYRQYAGGYLLNTDYLAKKGNKFVAEYKDGIMGDDVSLYTIYYYDVEVVMNDSIDELVSAKWEMQLKSNSAFAQDSAKYKFTLTVDKDITITVPNV